MILSDPGSLLAALMMNELLKSLSSRFNPVLERLVIGVICREGYRRLQVACLKACLIVIPLRLPSKNW